MNQNTSLFDDLLAVIPQFPNRHATTDPLFVNDRENNAFVRLDGALFERISTGQFRV